MTLAGWLFLIISFGVIIGLVVFCCMRVFKEPPEDI